MNASLPATQSAAMPQAAARRFTLQEQHEIEQFLYEEAALLDDRDWTGWENMFASGGVYWVPLAYDQVSPLDHASIFYEDDMMREVRRRRLDHARAWSQQPVTRTARIVGNVMLVEGSFEADALTVRSSFQMSEWRGRRDLRQISGRYVHELMRETGAGSWRIRSKRVDLINCDGVHNAYEVFL